MLLGPVEAHAILKQLIPSRLEDIKRLSQLDRKLCVAALDTLVRGEASAFPKDLETFHANARHICSRLYNRITVDVPQKPFIVRLFSRIEKGILNFFNLRISSQALYARVEKLKDTYLISNQAPFYALLNEEWHKAENDADPYCDLTFLVGLAKNPISEEFQANLRKRVEGRFLDITNQNLITLDVDGSARRGTHTFVRLDSEAFERVKPNFFNRNYKVITVIETSVN